MITMLPPLSDPVLTGLSDLLAEKIGIYFPRERAKDLERRINAAARELGYKDTQSCVKDLLTSSLARTQLEILASHLTIGETYFFREPKSFESIECQVLAGLINSRIGKDQHLRIWSAGCATGEEPYSLAILLHRMIPDIRDWNVSILATDINPRFLQKASEGVYTEWSFRGTPRWIKDKYFKLNAKGHYKIHSRIKRIVTFSYVNLAEDTYPALTNGTNAMDLILCRNVLMYFSTPQVKRVIENLRRCLVDGGWLAVSSVEVSHILFDAFEPVNFHDVTIYRKTDAYTKNHEIRVDYPPRTVVTELQPREDEPSIQTAEISFPFEETVLPAPAANLGPETAKTETGQYEQAAGLYQQGRYVEAADKLAAILTEVHQDPRAMELMARIQANQGQLTEAARWCEKAISHNKLDAACYYLLAAIQQERGQFNDAVAALKRALYLEPDLVLAHFALGNLARLQGKPREAGRHFANMLALLDKYQPEDILPESEGLTAKRLREIIETVNFGQEAA